ncbi:MAG: hypothetical protein ACRDU7_06210, partial [Acidimicrobiia bacterium]
QRSADYPDHDLGRPRDWFGGLPQPEMVVSVVIDEQSSHQSILTNSDDLGETRRLVGEESPGDGCKRAVSKL